MARLMSSWFTMMMENDECERERDWTTNVDMEPPTQLPPLVLPGKES